MTGMAFPPWLETTATLSLGLALASAAAITWDEFRRPQPMWIMAIVWPLTALFGSLLWLGFYLRWGRGPPPGADHGSTKEPPMAVAVAKGASHCGAGCALGDLIAEWLAYVAPGVAVAFGWRTLVAEKTFAVWGLDYLVAFLLGVAFQYFTIQPMRGLSMREGLVAAVKADFASITAWQVGMYGAMAILQFAWLRPTYDHIAPVTSPVFWFAMQLAMICGFVTAYPVNWMLIRAGLKERM